MNKICPLLSITNENNYCECLKEDCALWIKEKIKYINNISTEYCKVIIKEHCGLIKGEK